MARSHNYIFFVTNSCTSHTSALHYHCSSRFSASSHHYSNMSVLERLPYEIATEIFSYLPRTELAIVSRLTRQMHALCQPLLYRSLSLINSRRPGPPSSLKVILRSLLSPGGEKLATYVRSLHVQMDGDNTEPTPQCPNDLALFTGAASLLGLTKSLASQAGQVELLLHLLRRLHILSITTSNNSTDLFSHLIYTNDTTLASMPHPSCLHHLREFQCLDGGVSPKALLVLLQLPGIRKIAVHLTEEPLIPLHPIEAAAGTSPVTSLRFTSGYMNPGLLEHIFKIPIALTDLSFTAQNSYSIFPISRFGDHLQSLRGTLQHLHVDLSVVVPRIATHQPPSLFRLGSFRDWPALQTVRCSLSILLGRGMVPGRLRLSDVLPPGLRELDIQGDKFWSVEEEADRLIELLREEAVVISGMVKLAVGRGREGLRSKDRLLVACEATGVELVDNGKGRGVTVVVRHRPRRTLMRACGRSACNHD